jgi:UDP-3-O-[3-hydroxymyristoyl] N-acetylglucosamine deacetylase
MVERMVERVPSKRILVLPQQHSLKNPISCSGVGLHSGARVNMTLRPAGPNTGLVFRRTDVTDRNPEIAARWDTVVETVMCTTIGNEDGVRVATIEHLMSALAGCGIDNLIVELDGPEVPVMDGSAAPFVFLIECAGLVEQAAARRSIRVRRQIEVIEADARVALMPSRGFSVGFEIDFDTPVIERQSGFFDLHNGGFKREICRARTFGFERDVERLMQAGLARGGSLDNAVVIGKDDRILNEGGLRYSDEFVRHKVLDTVGDLYLAGGPLLAHFVGLRSGHALNNRLLSALLSDPTAWEYSDAAPVATVEPGFRWSEADEAVPLAATA